MEDNFSADGLGWGSVWGDGSDGNVNDGGDGSGSNASDAGGWLRR